ncbi:hypothetical protein YC2023_045982 [Brassica napus]
MRSLFAIGQSRTKEEPVLAHTGQARYSRNAQGQGRRGFCSISLAYIRTGVFDGSIGIFNWFDFS